MKKGEVWLVQIPSSNGHEQAGARPAIIIAETPMNVALIVPLTSNKDTSRFQHTIEITPNTSNGLVVDSVGLVFQLRAIDKLRLKKKIGDIDKLKLKEIDEKMRALLTL